MTTSNERLAGTKNNTPFTLIQVNFAAKQIKCFLFVCLLCCSNVS